MDARHFHSGIDFALGRVTRAPRDHRTFACLSLGPVTGCRARRVSEVGRYASRTHYTEKGASVNMTTHPSDPIARQAARMSTPVAGSLEELVALARIDEARIDDIETSSGRAQLRQRRALRRHWSDRGAQLG